MSQAARPLLMLGVLLAGLLALKSVSLGAGALDLIAARAEAQSAQDEASAGEEASDDAGTDGEPEAEAGAEAASSPAGGSDQGSEPAPSPFAGSAARQGRSPSAAGDTLGDTRAELELLSELSQRRRALDARAAELDTREQLIAVAESRVEDRIEALRTLKSEVETLLGTLDDRREAEIARIVEIYGALEPDAAANIITSLDESTRVLVAERMGSRKLAAILAEMAPGDAAALTVRMRQRAAPPETVGELRDRLDETATQ